MRVDELGKILAAKLEAAKPTYRATTIHLFGIEYADQIGSAATQVAISAGIGEPYGTEIRKGMKLAEFVTLKR